MVNRYLNPRANASVVSYNQIAYIKNDKTALVQSNLYQSFLFVWGRKIHNVKNWKGILTNE